MRDDPIRRFHWLQSVSLLPLLPSFRFATLLAQLPLAFQTITGRRLAAVMAIFRQPPFQFFDAKPRAQQEAFSLLDPPIFLRGFFFERC